MNVRSLTNEDQKKYNQVVTHIVQSWEWGNFRKALGQKVIRLGVYKNSAMVSAFQLTLHKLPFISRFVGYLPKGPFPDQSLALALTEIGKKYRCIAIKVEPNIDISKIKSDQSRFNRDQRSKIDSRFHPSPHSLFTKYNYVLDLTKSEEEILKNMHPKFRYNIKLAQKKGVKIEERFDEKALEIHLKLLFETTERQKFFAHNKNYHQKVWETLNKTQNARILIAFYKSDEDAPPLPLASWMLFNFHDTLYYPYGGSSEKYKNVMASNLLAWETIRLGKRLNLKKLDLWGAGDPNKGEKDSFSGFTYFKKQTGAKSIEYLGTFDLVFNWPLYWIFSLVDKSTKLKVFLLKVIGK